MFAPRSVAVVGASGDVTKLRGRLLKLLIGGGFAGPIWPVTPSATEVQGLKAFASLSDLPGVPDLVLVAVPGPVVPGILAEAARLGAGGGVVFTSDTDAEQIVAAAAGMPVLGPNTEGFYIAGNALAASFAPALDSFLAERDETGAPWPGRKVGIVSQSGGMGFASFGRLLREHCEIHAIVTTGNEASVDCLDVVDHLVDEGQTGVILLYVEGLQAAHRLGPIAEKARAAGIDIVALKVGNSAAGQRAALSHTAHLAGSDTAYRAVFARHGITAVDDQESLLAIVPGLARLPPMAGRRIAIVTSSGGAGTWAADQCEAAGLIVPELSPALQAQLMNLLPSFASAGNPVDVTGQVLEDGGRALVQVVRQLQDSDEIDAVLVNMGLGNPRRIEALAPQLQELAGAGAKPVLFHSHIHPAEESLAALARLGLVGMRSLRGCASALAALARKSEFRKVTPQTIDLQPVLSNKAGMLAMNDVSALLKAYGIRFAETRLVTRAEDVAAACGDAGTIAMKIQSPDIQHKTEAGGVALGVTPEDGAAVFDRIVSSSRIYAPAARIDGVTVQPMIPNGTEMIVGILDDADFGPLVMLGAGGIYAEVLRDTVFSPAPLDRQEAMSMIDALATADLLKGARGQAPGDVCALADLLVAVGAMAANEPELRQFDLNPVIVLPVGEGVWAVDALVEAGPR